MLAKPEVVEVSPEMTIALAPGARVIEVALVNLMPALVAQAITRQYADLLKAVAGRDGVRLHVFAPGGGAGAEDMSSLWARSFDALIVTGAEPRAEVITAEPFWPALAKLVEWAGENTVSAIFSCLAAHAAVFHLDGISRLRLGDKLSGVFECETVAGQGIFGRLPQRWVVPHSRYNALDEAALAEHGYTVLARGKRVGADSFFKRRHNSLFVFLQGHPEYAADTLLREYSRDVGRFLAGGQAVYPSMPEAYFDPESESALAVLRDEMMGASQGARVGEISRCLVRPPVDTWREAAASLYSGWLNYIAARKPVSSA